MLRKVISIFFIILTIIYTVSSAYAAAENITFNFTVEIINGDSVVQTSGSITSARELSGTEILNAAKNSGIIISYNEDLSSLTFQSNGNVITASDFAYCYKNSEIYANLFNLTAQNGSNVTLVFNSSKTQSVSSKSDVEANTNISSYASSDKSHVSSKVVSKHIKPASSKNNASSEKKESSQPQTSSLISSESVTSEISVSSENIPEISSGSVSQHQKPNQYQWSAALNEALDNACIWLKNNSTDWLYLVALGSAGRPAETKNVDRFIQQIKSTKGKYNSASELSIAVLGAYFCGLNPENISGINLLERIENYITDYKCNCLDLAQFLIALDCYESSSYQYLKSDILDTLLSMNNADGSYSHGKKNSDNTCGITATVLTAFSKHKQQAQSKITKGLSYIIKSQNPSGTFDDKSNELTSISRVIIMLSSLNMKIDDERFIKNEKNLVELLLEYQNPDGSFSSSLNGEPDETATEYAALALASIKNAENPYTINYQFDNNIETVQNEQFNIAVWLLAAFILLIILTVLAFFYFRTKHKTASDSSGSITYVFDDNDEPK